MICECWRTLRRPLNGHYVICLMPRRLVSLVAGVSLLLCVAVGTAWVRSLTIEDRWFFSPTAPVPTALAATDVEDPDRVVPVVTQRTLSCSEGRVRIIKMVSEEQYLMPAGYWSAGVELLRTRFPRQDDEHWQLLGFEYRHRLARYSGVGVWKSRSNVDTGETSMAIPLWFLFVITAALPAVVAARWIRRGRRSRMPGLCAACGYDLRASAERCPECGMSFGAAIRPADNPTLQRTGAAARPL